VVTRDNINHFLNQIEWAKFQASHYVFKIISPRRQPATIEIHADGDTIVYNNGKLASRVYAAKAVEAGGRAYLPVMLEAGRNIINVKQHSIGPPGI
jgi:hypothetical protein